jgi:alpha-aminoadipate carrier protein LysW
VAETGINPNLQSNQKEFQMSDQISQCPECDATIDLKDVMLGEIIVCPDCGVDLEVTSLSPAEVSLAPMEEEDWGE